jgi:3'(2'), 5'-bisphosphate nucleotidase
MTSNFKTENQSNIDQLLKLAVKASLKAGEEILEVYKSTIDVELKDDRSPLTQADKNAHRMITSILNPYDIPVLSEEGKEIPYSDRSKWPLFWLVDPLDGTKEFIKKNGEFTVNIALIKAGSPVMGVVFIPVSGELYYGGYGWRSKKTQVVRNEDGHFLLPDLLEGTILPMAAANQRPYTVVCSRSHMSPETNEFVDEIKKEHTDLEFVSRGSSIKLCLIAEGSADIYPRFAPTMEWDTAAGHAVVVFSGAEVKEAGSGRPLSYNKEDLLNPWFIASR